MAGQKFKARDKEVLQMTKDGATVKNLSDDSEIRVSKRDKNFNPHSRNNEDNAEYGVPPESNPRIPPPKQSPDEPEKCKLRNRRRHSVSDENNEAGTDSQSDGAAQETLVYNPGNPVAGSIQPEQQSAVGTEGTENITPVLPFPSIKTPRQNLREFTNRKIGSRRRLDILEEKHESKLDKAIYDSQRLKDDFIAEKKLVSAKRSGIIRAEYGSVSEYNKFSQAAKADECRDGLIKSKLKLQKQRNALITDEYGGRLKFNEARKSVNFKPSDSLKTVDNKLTSVNSQIKAESGKLNGFYASHGLAEMKSSNSREKLKSLQRKMLQKSEILAAIEAECYGLDVKINNESSKIRALTEEKSDIATERNSLNSVRTMDKSKLDDYSGKLKSAKDGGDKLEIKSAKADYRLAKSRYKFPKQRIVRKSYSFDEKSGKVKTRMKIENEVKPIDGRSGIVTKGIKGGAKAISTTAAVGIHRQISKYEEDNSALKAAHGAEKAAERAGRIGVRTVKAVGTKIKESPYKKASKLKFRSEKENAKLRFSKSVTQNKETVNSAESAKKAARKSMMKKNAGKTASSSKSILQKTSKAMRRILYKNKFFIIGIAAVLLILCVISSISAAFMAMLSESGGMIIASAYMSEDADMQNAESYMISLESDLQSRIDSIPNDYPGFDEYRYNLDGTGHDPYALISFLSAKDIVFEYDEELQADIAALFNALYTLEFESIHEIRSYTYTEYDEQGNPYEATVEYDYYILETTLTANDFDAAASELLNDQDLYELYTLLQETQGGRPDLF
jgi:hypothetical protein